MKKIVDRFAQPADDDDHFSLGSGSHPQPSKQNHVAMAKKYRLWQTTADKEMQADLATHPSLAVKPTAITNSISTGE